MLVACRLAGLSALEGTASHDKTARIWDVFPDTEAFVSAAKAAIPRCLTPAQRKAFFLPPEPPAWCIELAKWPYNAPEWKQLSIGVEL
jgi:hypothetical protein